MNTRQEDGGGGDVGGRTREISKWLHLNAIRDRPRRLVNPVQKALLWFTTQDFSSSDTHIITRLHSSPICFSSGLQFCAHFQRRSEAKSLPSQMCGTAVIYERQPFFIYNTNSRPRRKSKLCLQYSILYVSTWYVMRSIDYYVKQSVLLKYTVRESRI